MQGYQMCEGVLSVVLCIIERSQTKSQLIQLIQLYIYVKEILQMVIKPDKSK